MNAVRWEMEDEATAAAAASTLLKEQVAERLAAHRSRRSAMPAGGGLAPRVDQLEPRSSTRSQQIALAVAERYARTPSYHELLAAEAEEATRRARAAAEVSARNAEAVAAAQRELMEELAGVSTLATEPEVPGSGSGFELVAAAAVEATPAVTDIQPAAIEQMRAAPAGTAAAQGSRARLSVRLPEGAERRQPEAGSQMESAWHETPVEDAEEARALDEEISFRQSPTFELERPSVAIPGNLLEFPRQLVAARKARPRYAEGPLGAEGGHDGAQLRIFEVQAEQMEATPPVESAAAEWSSIWLDALAEVAPVESPEQAEVRLPMEVAPVERRVMAAMVDVCLVLAGYVGFAAVFAYRAAVLPSLGVAAVGSVGVLAGLFVMYQALFFGFSEATPGMRYARIGLCTFEDENPTRAAMQKRIWAVLLSGCPLGLGFLWAWVDDERLGWHDRMSRMYQRGY